MVYSLSVGEARLYVCLCVGDPVTPDRAFVVAETPVNSRAFRR